MICKYIAQNQLIVIDDFKKQDKDFVNYIVYHTFNLYPLMEVVLLNQDKVNEKTIPHILRQTVKFYKKENNPFSSQYLKFNEKMLSMLYVFIPIMNIRNLASTAKSVAFLNDNINVTETIDMISRYLLLRLRNTTQDYVSNLDLLDFLQACSVLRINISQELIDYTEDKIENIRIVSTKDLMRLIDVFLYNRVNAKRTSGWYKFKLNSELDFRLRKQLNEFREKDITFILELAKKHRVNRNIEKIVVELETIETLISEN